MSPAARTALADLRKAYEDLARLTRTAGAYAEHRRALDVYDRTGTLPPVRYAEAVHTALRCRHALRAALAPRRALPSATEQQDALSELFGT